MAIQKNARRTAIRPGAASDAWEALYGRHQSSKSAGRFVRERLPEPADYFAAEGVELRGRGPWRDALCPFHADTTPSLRVHVESGAFRCMACGASGMDVLDFHRKRHGLTFVQAAKALGCWEVTP
jgi:hypothetical protein